MNTSRYPLDYFPEESFAKRYADDTPQPQLFLNSFGSGGLYSTPMDMAKIAMMFLGKGRVGTVRILSEASVAAMGVDQTLSSFNPVKSKSFSYGLGWDTVIQPGLAAVGVTGWQKGGGCDAVRLDSDRCADRRLGSGGHGGFERFRIR